MVDLVKRDKIRKSIEHRTKVIRYDLEKLGKRIAEGRYANYNHSYNFEGLRDLLEELKGVESSVKNLLDEFTERD